MLSYDVERCAQYHNNKHCVKMILEYAQLLSAAHHLNNNSIKDKLYKLSHTNHPSTVWVAGSAGAYNYVLSLFEALCKEYTHRYGKVHLSYKKCYHHFRSLNPCKRIATPIIPLCMPDKYKTDCPVQSYRNYYIGDKQHLRIWTKRHIPYWWR